jgi:uncharacterized C2H2 Zn-finger protein
MTTITKTTEKRLQCPRCPRTFQRATGLGSHMRSAHGVVGNSPTTLAARNKSNGHDEPRSPDPASVAPPELETPDPALTCPECQATGTVATFPSTRELGKHRRFKHGVIGRITQKTRDRAGVGSLNLTVPDHRLPTIERSTHNYAARSQNDALTPKGETQPNGFAVIDPLALALAVGSVQEFCRHLAEEHDTPARQFTRHVAELLLRQTRR